MDVIFFIVFIAAILLVLAFGLNSLRQIKGVAVFPLLRFAGKEDPVHAVPHFSQNLSDVSPENEGNFSPQVGGEEMIPVEQIMQKEPLIIRSEESVKTVAEKMLQYHVGGLLVEDGEGVVQGIVTETDIVRKVTAKDISPAVIQVEQVMSTPVISIDRTQPITKADELMDRHHTRHLGVTENGRIIGILSVRDLLHPIYEEHKKE